MAGKKLTTMEQLRALAEKGKLDTLTRIDALLEVITPLLSRCQVFVLKPLDRDDLFITDIMRKGIKRDDPRIR